ncbi:TetR/AcrR family transcriptional regulator [uncultured Alistipes sp.]|uniref:TetR/AcrR family transcriptional regulator n=1 Tax=uncultured Alistipes sp. TaxID=538949 RepID=UPI00262622B6|nr:TetR/AcrR family transcriptional regulator [uncultured Alistipes sp.]
MKRGATKEEIIRTTQDLIARNGIRAVRVDEIAQMLGISKRTLYEMFVDKNGLISACLDSMAHQQRKTLASNRRRCGGNPLQRALRLANTYIDNLYTVDASFLADIRDKVLFAEYYNENRDFWVSELTRDLEKCRKEELLLAEIDTASLTQQLMSTMLELRLNHATREELRLLCRTILRGAATRRGIDIIDQRR